MKKEVLSFVTLFAIGVATVFGVLWVNEKRQLTRMMRTETAQTETADSMQVTAAVITPGAPSLKAASEIIDLPKPQLRGKISVEEALQTRRSRRAFSDKPVTKAELGQILWAAQGVTDENGHRTAPSARSLYPFNTYIVIRNVQGVTAGLYQYYPEKHQIGNIGLANAGELLAASGVQDNSQKAPVVIVLAGVYGKMVEKFPQTYVESTMMEAGHIGQNVYLQVESLGMSTVVTAGFDVKKVGDALKLDPAERIAYLIPLGHTGTEPSPTAE